MPVRRRTLSVGNIPTEKVIEALRGRGADLPALKPLDALLRASAGIREQVQDFVIRGLTPMHADSQQNSLRHGL